MLSKIWYVTYVEKLPVDIIRNIRKDIHDFHWKYRKVRVNIIMLTAEMRRLVMMDIETQCEAIQCSIFAKCIKDKNQNKPWTNLMAFGSIQKSEIKS